MDIEFYVWRGTHVFCRSLLRLILPKMLANAMFSIDLGAEADDVNEYQLLDQDTYGIPSRQYGRLILAIT